MRISIAAIEDEFNTIICKWVSDIIKLSAAGGIKGLISENVAIHQTLMVSST